MILIVTCLAWTSLAAASPGACTHALGGFGLSVDLRRDVAELESVVDERRTEVDAIKRAHGDLYHHVHRVKAGLGWRERHLAAWLAAAVGGDAGERKAFVRRRRELTVARTDLDRANAALHDANRRVVEAIEAWLNAHDPGFAALTTQESELLATARFGDAALAAIDKAVTRVSSARSADVVAGVFDNKGADLLAIIDETRANAAVEAVKAAVTTYGTHLRMLSHAGEALDASHVRGVDLNLQIMLDFGTGSSFMDWYNAIKLGQTKEQLVELRSRVVTVQTDLAAARERLLVEINSRLGATREECRAGRGAMAPWGSAPP